MLRVKRFHFLCVATDWLSWSHHFDCCVGYPCGYLTASAGGSMERLLGASATGSAYLTSTDYQSYSPLSTTGCHHSTSSLVMDPCSTWSRLVLSVFLNTWPHHHKPRTHINDHAWHNGPWLKTLGRLCVQTMSSWRPTVLEQQQRFCAADEREEKQTKQNLWTASQWLR